MTDDGYEIRSHLRESNYFSLFFRFAKVKAEYLNLMCTLVTSLGVFVRPKSFILLAKDHKEDERVHGCRVDLRSILILFAREDLKVHSLFQNFATSHKQITY